MSLKCIAQYQTNINIMLNIIPSIYQDSLTVKTYEYILKTNFYDVSE